MICPGCGAEDFIVMHVDDIPCSHCHGMIELSHNICKKCQVMWSSVDGEILNAEIDIDTLAGGLNNIFNQETDTLQVIELNNRGTMDEMIHRCLRCETISYEIKPNVFHCPDCGLEWEVI